MAQPTSPHKQVTMKMIAAHCGLHLATVSAALRRDRRFVSEATVARVHAAAEELGYDPAETQAARRLQARSFNTKVANQAVAVFLPHAFHAAPFFWRLFYGLYTVLTEQDYAVTLVSTFSAHPPHEDRTDVPAIMRRGEMDGALVVAQPEGFAALLAGLRNAAGFGDRPLVALVYEQPQCVNVLADEYRGGYAAMAHLLALGHRHMLYYLESSQPIATHAGSCRLQGFQQAMREHGLDPAQHLHLAVYPYGALREVIPDSLPAMLQMYPQVTAIIALNDYIAWHMVERLRGMGYRLPEDLSLIGFDDTHPMPDAQGTPWLTTVSLPLEEIGQAGARCLLAQFQENDVPADQPILFPTTLVVRQSTAPPRR
ncbi:MAG TPA: LacI family DNA-binding transcriptional regulator [Armatimonadota bacterium]|jgi:DNA-binding LacI/PurR family transcriptional regulator